MQIPLRLRAGYTVQGMLHMVVNNQVGFTTAPREGRSSVHATDMARAVGAPVLHVNADDPEAVVAACEIAADWRALWRRDVVVDLVGYRRHGHNELDNPKTTLPLTYERIQRHPRVLNIYAQRLHARGLTTPALLQDIQVLLAACLTLKTLLQCMFTKLLAAFLAAFSFAIFDIDVSAGRNLEEV
jgi:2-oxoglutarate dehydrogenase E1 component